jgi:diaminopimelate decarboxylase
MKSHDTQTPTDPDQIGSRAAIKRAALRARELARQMNTPCYVVRNQVIVDISHETQTELEKTNKQGQPT